MEINLNTSNISFGNLAGIADTKAAEATEKKSAFPSGGLKITNGAASAEDVQAAGIPESALSRDDALGKLMSQAFNLPPPPMPKFE